ncbi:MAG: hypothetical protein K8T89_08425 [Planctomycetes bacterium]|nr:hypothetical protein [Planctomycetota bacterium]
MLTSTVPITIGASAQERIDQLGLQTEFEAVLEHAVQTVPGLIRVDVKVDEHELPEHQAVILDATTKHLEIREELEIEDAQMAWRYQVYPPEVAMHFAMTASSEI